jgi:hypothetical protein
MSSDGILLPIDLYRNMAYTTANLSFLRFQIVARPELWNKTHQSSTSTVPGGFPGTINLGNEPSSSWSSCSC